MFLSQEIDIKLCQNYTESYIYQISYKIRSAVSLSRDTRDQYTTLLLAEVSVT